MRRLLAAAIVALPLAFAQVAEAQIAPPTDFRAAAPPNDGGRNIRVTWTASPSADDERYKDKLGYMVFRTPFAAPGAPPEPRKGMKRYDWVAGWELAFIGIDNAFNDDVFANKPGTKEDKFVFMTERPAEFDAQLAAEKAAREEAEEAAKDRAAREKRDYFIYAIRTVELDADGGVVGWSSAVLAGPAKTKTSYFHTGHWFYFVVVVLMALLLLVYYRRIKKNPEDVFIRRIAGVDAIEDAVGRSTEMGRPVLYVTGTDDVQNIQTIASLLVLGRVSEMTAEYDTEIKVANLYPLTMVVAEEIVRQGFADAGRIDAHKPENVMFISAEQFAFAAGINGIILRDKPATNIYLGRYFAESLILAETGYVTGAVQIAGTAEIPQLPFFVAACDYTLIGEELYAVSAYLTREPGLLAMLKATDMVKLIVMVTIIAGMLMNFAGVFDLREVLFP